MKSRRTKRKDGTGAFRKNKCSVLSHAFGWGRHIQDMRQMGNTTEHSVFVCMGERDPEESEYDQ